MGSANVVRKRMRTSQTLDMYRATRNQVSIPIACAPKCPDDALRHEAPAARPIEPSSRDPLLCAPPRFPPLLKLLVISSPPRLGFLLLLPSFSPRSS